ncbi:type I-Fv CRISPR-associated protein Cas5fv [Thiothrix fructosivorans]|uniref:Cas5fv helical domain-containing protein n=1 Tax=Thiothrix fructosivorans TaxID=111770 RepID=A0A8B0SM17_9GAMM|nr:type I-Fv CRISPR-associated protein Cas5fv [Thiothrix fructosivorans]MBO0615185.1 hypothetical protein [Thiothrix fructosivorans]QTX09972.1 hypothetical protein J1836_015390 [Thiothrix fructosivorans]
MKITIEYESSWRNSFLDGSNNEPLPKTSKGVGRNFVGSMTSLKTEENFIKREVTLDTVMGILNRLIGDQRKLYQARAGRSYFFADIEPLITFVDRPSCINHEMTYIRNITGSTDQNSYTGMVKVSDPIFSSDYSTKFWGVLALDFDVLCDFIVQDTAINAVIEANPLVIIERLEEINKFKPVENAGVVNDAFLVLKKRFEKFNGLNQKGEVLPISLYCSALYLQLERLSKTYDLSTARTKSGGISGISNNGFTKKDFMNCYTTGDKKKIWGNPYIRKERIKGVGEVTSLMKKASGTLEIQLLIERDKSKVLEAMISAAGVSSFYLGKKGLAYVSDIRV